jgi:nucleoside-diphosphate-sugar epimerase
MKILATGGAGFIGSHLVNRLKLKGHEVDIFDITSGHDLRNVEQVGVAIKGKDAVFHLAAIADLSWARNHSKETMDINVLGTINVAEGCGKYKVPLYYASTCCVYGNQKKHPSNESTPPNPSEIYAYTKLAGEEVIKGYGELTGLRYNLMRFATIYGEKMRSALGVHIFLRQALKGQPITVHGDGKQTRTLTYIDDLVDGMVMLFESNLFLREINLSTEESISAISMAKRIKKLTKSKSPIVFIPQRPGQTFKEEIDASKAKNKFGWKTKTPFNKGLERTLAWMREIPLNEL